MNELNADKLASREVVESWVLWATRSALQLCDMTMAG